MNKVVLAALRDESVTKSITLQQARNFDRTARMDLADLQENELTRNLNKYFNKKIGHSRYHAFRIRDILTKWKTKEDAIFGEIIVCKRSFEKTNDATTVNDIEQTSDDLKNKKNHRELRSDLEAYNEFWDLKNKENIKNMEIVAFVDLKVATKPSEIKTKVSQDSTETVPIENEKYPAINIKSILEFGKPGAQVGGKIIDDLKIYCCISQKGTAILINPIELNKVKSELPLTFSMFRSKSHVTDGKVSFKQFMKNDKNNFVATNDYVSGDDYKQYAIK